MIVSWNWIREYVRPDAALDDVLHRLTMAGLKLESRQTVGDDVAIDLEVTSNRPDCLGHIGVAREVAVLYGCPLNLPQLQPKTTSQKTTDVTSVINECPDLCPQYTARLIRGVKVGPSPAWLRNRLATLGQTSINNVADATNYVLFEYSQPLHAFDLDRLRQKRIVVRRARPGEKIVAIDQKTYQLAPPMCVIADADRPVGIGGVMGGLETEISPATRNVLIEAANFAPLSIRGTARKLQLHSDASYRFERGINPTGLDSASRRVCQLILEIAGGELLDEPIVVPAVPPPDRPVIRLRFDRIPTILGIDVDPNEAVRILAALGAAPRGARTNGDCDFVPPTWRRDLTREIDLIEEVARIHGYDRIPQDVTVPLQKSAKTVRDRVCEAVRFVLTGAGFYEAVTMSFVSDGVCDLFQPRGPLPKLHVEHPSRKHENVLRQSLIPSLLLSRQINERHGTFGAKLFEIAKVYLDAGPNRPEAEREPTMIGIVSGQSFHEMKGVVVALADRICPGSTLRLQPSRVAQFGLGRGADLLLDGKPWGWVGELDRGVTDAVDLKDPVTVVELDLGLLESNAVLVPTYQPLALFPAVERDLNFVLDEAVTWESLAGVVRESAGPLLEQVGFADQYRGKQIEPGKKSYLVTLNYRAADRTLTSDEVEACQKAVIEACATRLGGRLR